MTVYNFNPGPATLPSVVLEQAQAALVDWQNLGISILEVSHRSPEFKALADASVQDLRELLAIPQSYKILFLPGGGRSQFAMVPLNLLGKKNRADYLDTGIWSRIAGAEGTRYGHIHWVASNKEQPGVIPPPESWNTHPEAAYFHYVDNETIEGVEFPYIPPITSVPLVADMSSNFLSRTFPITSFGLIYAAAQKNAGPAGITVVILHESLLGKALPMTPSMFNYTLHAHAHSLYNTALTFNWFVTHLVFKWIQQQGGVAALEKINQRKSAKLYAYIDQSSLYENSVDPRYRSRMNVVFHLTAPQLEPKFLHAASDERLLGLKGHTLVGGLRASLYNALPEAGVDKLIEFMKEFERVN